MQAQDTPEERVGGHPRTARSWQCQNLTPAQSGAHPRFEFRLSGLGQAATSDTALGQSLRVVEIAFDERGTAVQLRDRAYLEGLTGRVVELAGVRDAADALVAREWSLRTNGGVAVRDVEPALLSTLDEMAQMFWAMRCTR